MSYKTCKWCGRKFNESDAVYSGLGSIFGNDFGGGVYCSEKCKAEAEAKRANSNKNSYDDDDHSTGLLGVIWKAIKWGIIIMVVWFVYDNYIKNDKTDSKTANTYSTTQSNAKTGTKSISSYSENMPNVSLTEINQVAYSWSEAHNSRNLLQLSSLYASQVNYYQSKYSREQIKASKEKLMNKYPDFKQEISNVTVEKETSYYKISFDKKVWTDLQKEPKTYPSYLHVNMVDGTWKIITESDLVTDKNLSKKKK